MISFLIFIKIVLLFIIVFAIRRKVRKRPSEPGSPFTMPRSRERTLDFSIRRDVILSARKIYSSGCTSKKIGAIIKEKGGGG